MVNQRSLCSGEQPNAEAKNSRIKIGAIEVIVITDSLGPFPFPASRVFPTVTETEWKTMRQRYPSAFSTPETLMAHVTCCLVRSGQRNVLVDTGMGISDAPQSGLRGDLLRQIESEGLTPGEVDTVVLTHLDADHVGGNINGEGTKAKPIFSNAQYITSSVDWEICAKPPTSSAHARFKPDQILPLQGWGMLTLATGEMEIADGIRLIQSSGHTPGHMSLWIESEGGAILLAGDAFYQPLQVPVPRHTFPLDMDQSRAETTRLRLLELVESKSAYMWACHFPAPAIGRLIRNGETRYWEPINAH
jgi:glyoxylase-like metal-dependent hydrolase (beta-lactamase superfamily II)